MTSLLTGTVTLAGYQVVRQVYNCLDDLQNDIFQPGCLHALSVETLCSILWIAFVGL